MSLSAAQDAAKLTRLCYDVFVSPIVQLAASVAGDFLSVTLQAVQTARGFLMKFNQDNSTLAALQTMLSAWLTSVERLPKQIQEITDSDLDGAQAYLRGLQRELETQKAKLH